MEKTKQMSDKLNKSNVPKNNVYVPKSEITTIPSGWNGEDTNIDDCYFYGSLYFLCDPKENVYSLEDGEEIK